VPYYKGVLDELIAKGHPKDAQEVASRLLSLRNRLEKQLPERNVLSSLLLATWNIRELGADKKFGTRLDESLLYIAEIVSHFDLVAMQEVHENLSDLQDLMRLLGGWWDYLVTDVTLGSSGNSERIAFIYDSRKVRFDHLAGELVLPPIKKKSVVQPARSPFLCAFKAGWRRVSLCSVHIFFGKSKPDDPRRIEEIRAISEALAKRNERRQNIADGEPESVVLLGDFNIFNAKTDATAKALQKNKFIVPKALLVKPSERMVDGDEAGDPLFTNALKDKHFDQIAFHDPKRRLQASKGGVFDFQQVIYGADEAEKYRSAMERSAPDKFAKASASAKALEKFYRQWRTFQVSDHLPLWVELKTDFADNYLASVMRGRKSSPAANKARKEAEATSPVVTPPPIADAPPKPPASPARKARAGAKKKGGAKKASRKAA
jgi:endonuclease/exonuclease/phosphatase family metal-dependent hydrolase